MKKIKIQSLLEGTLKESVTGVFSRIYSSYSICGKIEIVLLVQIVS